MYSDACFFLRESEIIITTQSEIIIMTHFILQNLFHNLYHSEKTVGNWGFKNSKTQVWLSVEVHEAKIFWIWRIYHWINNMWIKMSRGFLVFLLLRKGQRKKKICFPLPPKLSAFLSWVSCLEPPDKENDICGYFLNSLKGGYNRTILDA